MASREPSRELDRSLLVCRLGYNLREADNLMRREFVEATSDWKINPAQYAVLALTEMNAPVTQAELCAALGLLRPNMVTLMAPLERSGLIRRSVLEQDRRNVLLSLTPKGKRVRKALEGRILAAEDRLTHRLSSPQKKTLNDLLRLFSELPADT